ncbi:CobW family GTP-binding protein [Noviherbaspirillum sedimenti]|uniref:GTP-binding protein n=1 Tax=Noviherbaspirillum sedimenti TaxID=2320865 RepID=A0A3A3G4K7_9BURK|nr:GTP-binding protein [Noviherbaspirillum sedimenti]RJG03418.1 GTP-binding protein [Noviherbaspirillum sedimenti]
MALIPTTILTGFLGAGKTTLLNRILQEAHGHKIAVIENEFGPENIDNAILVRDSNEQIIEMNNGCICCTVRGDLIEALGNLARQRAAGTLQFDRVVIETTGLANPGPVAQTFFMDDEVAAHYMLDAIVTVVDARHAMQQLDAQEEAQRQVGFADRILLSKTDLVDEDAIDALTQRLRRINPRAPIGRADFGRVPIADVLDLRGFNLNDKLEIDPDFLRANDPGAHTHDEHQCDADCGHEHDHGHEHAHHHEHEHGHPHAQHHHDQIAAFAFISERPFDSQKLDEFLSSAIQVFGPQLLRYKGILWMAGGDRKVIFQGVHQMMGTDLGAKWQDHEQRGSRMVFIGKDLPKDIFISGLQQCLV